MGRLKRVLWWAGIAIGSLLIVALAGGWIFQTTATASAFRRYRPPGRMIDVGGRRLHIHCTGNGPTVVLESGFGGWSIDWWTVQDRIAAFARVCSYDRAGMGWSDRGPASATSRKGIARDLNTLLRRARVKGPYVLVGHSLGGIYVREFARLYPEQTAGLVFVDSTHEEISRSVSRKELERVLSQVRMLRFARYLMPFGVQHAIGLSISNAPELPRDLRPMAKAIGYRSSSYFALYDGMVSLVAEDRSKTLKLEPIPQVPLTVITSEENLKDPEHGRVWRKLQDELAAMVPGSRHIVAKGSGHFVAVDRPGLVIDAVRDMLRRASAAPAVPR